MVRSGDLNSYERRLLLLTDSADLALRVSVWTDDSRWGPTWGPVVGVHGVHKFGDVDTASEAKVRASAGKLKVVVSRISPDDP